MTKRKLGKVGRKSDVLSLKQERFCQLIASGECLTYSDAYRQSYDCKNMAKRTINNEAINLLKLKKVVERIDELKRKFINDISYGVIDAIKELTEAYKGAKNRGEASNEIKAIVEKCKILGLYEEVIKLKGDKTAPLENKLIVEFIGKNEKKQS